ncbi:hypothetical protein YPPY05_1029, partial [Yersinia pestis PY-05]
MNNFIRDRLIIIVISNIGNILILCIRDKLLV